MKRSRQIASNAIFFALFLLLTPLALWAYPPAIANPNSIPVSIQERITGTVITSHSFHDRLGNHFLILSRTTSKTTSDEAVIELLAQQFILSGKEYRREWVIRDYQSCQGLDIEASFLTNLTSFTDLDSNQIIESTIAYQLLCAGDIQPKTVKAIMRQGIDKYAIRGKSLIQIPGMPIEGGEYELGKELENKDRFRDHLLSIWGKAAGLVLIK
jgi:hypothetical protein